MSCCFVCLGVFFREPQDSSGDRQLQMQLRMTVSAPLFKRCGSKEGKGKVPSIATGGFRCLFLLPFSHGCFWLPVNWSGSERNRQTLLAPYMFICPVVLWVRPKSSEQRERKKKGIVQKNGFVALFKPRRKKKRCWSRRKNWIKKGKKKQGRMTTKKKTQRFANACMCACAWIMFLPPCQKKSKKRGYEWVRRPW